MYESTTTSISTRLKQHSLANHGMLPDKDDVQELVIYLTLLFIVLSWMLREIHIAFFTEDSETPYRRDPRSDENSGNSPSTTNIDC